MPQGERSRHSKGSRDIPFSPTRHSKRALGLHGSGRRFPCILLPSSPPMDAASSGQSAGRGPARDSKNPTEPDTVFIEDSPPLRGRPPHPCTPAWTPPWESGFSGCAQQASLRFLHTQFLALFPPAWPENWFPWRADTNKLNAAQLDRAGSGFGHTVPVGLMGIAGLSSLPRASPAPLTPPPFLQTPLSFLPEAGAGGGRFQDHRGVSRALVLSVR